MKHSRKIFALIVMTTLLVVLSGCGGDITRPITLNTKNWFDWIFVIPVGWVMQLISGWFNNNFGIGIIFTTIIIRTIAWPIYAKSNDLSIKMAVAQPDIQRIQAKYANRKDRESQQRMQMETQQVYKKYGINLLGCFMPLIQMPIFIAVYQTVQRIWINEKVVDGVVVSTGVWAHKVNNMNFLGIDLSSKGNFNAIFGQGGDWKGWLLAILVAGTNILLTYLSMRKPSYQKQTAMHGPQSQTAEQSQKMMKYMQWFMVIMMFGISLGSNSLALYWVVGNTYSIGQNLINRKINEKKYYKMRNQDLVVKSYD